MTTTERLQISEKANNYLELIKTCEACIESHKSTVFDYPDFMNMTNHYEERIRINNRMISRMNKRVDDLLIKIIK